MIATIFPSINQMRFSLLEIKNLFDDLDNETAIYEAKRKLSDLLEYLECIRSANDTLVVTGGPKGSSNKIKIEHFISNSQRVY